MGTLQSRLFTSAPPDVYERLENCANGSPNEVLSHFTQGQSGEHIRLVQEALQSVAENEPGLNIPAFDVSGVYDGQFAQAVASYKQARNILNYANQVDNIVGIKTIRSLDLDNTSAPPRPYEPPEPRPTEPVVQPRPDPLCVSDSECPVSRSFTIQLLAGLTGGEILELGAFFFEIRDTEHNLWARYLGKVVGVGVETPIPVSPSVLGDPTPFGTGTPCKVTRFIAFGFLSVALSPPFAVSASPVTLTYKGVEGVGTTVPFLLDSGPMNLPGAGAYVGALELQTECHGTRGASRRSIL